MTVGKGKWYEGDNAVKAHVAYWRAYWRVYYRTKREARKANQ